MERCFAKSDTFQPCVALHLECSGLCLFWNGMGAPRLVGPVYLPHQGICGDSIRHQNLLAFLLPFDKSQTCPLYNHLEMPQNRRIWVLKWITVGWGIQASNPRGQSIESQLDMGWFNVVWSSNWPSNPKDENIIEKLSGEMVWKRSICLAEFSMLRWETKGDQSFSLVFSGILVL